MKLYIKTAIILFLTNFSVVIVSAATFIIESPAKALSNRQQIVVQVYIDGQKDSLSGIGGNFSFSEELFNIDSISTQGSVVSLWVNDPKISQERFLDGRKHIQFEAIFPGGFDGVRSAYYEGGKPGLLFSVILVPKNKGQGTFVVDDAVLLSFSNTAEALAALPVVKSIEVPDLQPLSAAPSKEMTRIENKTLNVFVSRDPLINMGAWYLILNEPQSRSSIEQIFIAESDNDNGEDLRQGEYHSETLPYVLFHQDRAKYIHVKVVYTDKTYTIRTIPPVENSKSISTLSRILISIVALLVVALFYGNNLILSIRKKI